MIVYCATNKVNGKKYIGITSWSLKLRQQTHESHARTNKNKTYFANALRKYGKHNFSWEILETCNTWDELLTKERLWIQQFQSKSPNGYNMTSGGEGCSEMPTAIRNQISQSLQKSRPKLSETHKRKISEALKGKNRSKEHRENLSQALRGKPPWNKGLKRKDKSNES